MHLLVRVCEQDWYLVSITRGPTYRWLTWPQKICMTGKLAQSERLSLWKELSGFPPRCRRLSPSLSCPPPVFRPTGQIIHENPIKTPCLVYNESTNLVSPLPQHCNVYQNSFFRSKLFRTKPATPQLCKAICQNWKKLFTNTTKPCSQRNQAVFIGCRVESIFSLFLTVMTLLSFLPNGCNQRLLVALPSLLPLLPLINKRGCVILGDFVSCCPKVGDDFF